MRVTSLPCSFQCRRRQVVEQSGRAKKETAGARRSVQEKQDAYRLPACSVSSTSSSCRGPSDDVEQELVVRRRGCSAGQGARRAVNSALVTQTQLFDHLEGGELDWASTRGGASEGSRPLARARRRYDATVGHLPSWSRRADISASKPGIQLQYKYKKASFPKLGFVTRTSGRRPVSSCDTQTVSRG